MAKDSEAAGAIDRGEARQIGFSPSQNGYGQRGTEGAELEGLKRLAVEARNRQGKGGPVALPAPFLNAAGEIQNLLEQPCGGVSIITSRAGSIRSQHYHRTDAHWLFVVSGAMHYYERAVGSSETPAPLVVRSGEMVYTPEMREHATLFPVDTVLVSMSRFARTHAAHEADLVRVKVI